MRSLLVAAVATFLATQSNAAETVKINWNGVYFGANIGGAYGSAGSQNVVDTNLGGFDPYSFEKLKAVVIGGVHLGYNWTTATPWMTGVEADFSFLSRKNSNFVTPVTAAGGFPIAGSTLRMSDNMRWLASLRARTGYVWDQKYFYVTGGLALSNTDRYARLNPVGNWAEISLNEINPGWVAGAGMEWSMNQQWVLRTEYLFYSFGTQTTETFFLPAPCGGCSQAVNYSWKDSYIHSLRFGLSRRFNTN